MAIDDFSVKAICRAPTNSSVEISSNNSPAKESDHLNASIIANDPDGVSFVSANDWRVNGTSFAVQNFSFDANGTDGLTNYSSQGGTLTRMEMLLKPQELRDKRMNLMVMVIIYKILL